MTKKTYTVARLIEGSENEALMFADTLLREEESNLDYAWTRTVDITTTYRIAEIIS